jgi:hypothetical protein
MAQIKKSIRDALEAAVARQRIKQARSTSEPTGDNSAGRSEPLLFDTITLESILSLRGQNHFHEEEGEIGFMSSTMREQSLHLR